MKIIFFFNKIQLQNSPKMSKNEFNFPFTPYEIQENFMRALFQTLDHSQFGIFESRKCFTFVRIIFPI